MKSAMVPLSLIRATCSQSSIVSVSSRTFNETRGQFVDDDLAAPPNDQIGPAVTISGVAVFGRSTSSPTSRSNRMGELVDNLVLNQDHTP